MTQDQPRENARENNDRPAKHLERAGRGQCEADVHGRGRAKVKQGRRHQD